MARIVTAEGRKIAVEQVPGAGPGVMFLGGFRSDMTGTKAAFLRDWAVRRGRAFTRFDYSGHGASGGKFEDGCIGDWLEDARAVLGMTEGKQVLVGSSMGGWIALLLARVCPERVAGLVGVAAAPDFSEDLMWAGFSDVQRAEVMERGVTYLPSGFATPDPITKRFIEDGRRHLVLRGALGLPFPVRLLQGAADEVVPVALALRLLGHVECPDARLTLVKGADHRFSAPECLAMMAAAVEDVSGGVG